MYWGLWATFGRAGLWLDGRPHPRHHDDAVADGVDVIVLLDLRVDTYIVSPTRDRLPQRGRRGRLRVDLGSNSGDTVGEQRGAQSPWTMTVAASTSDRGRSSPSRSVTDDLPGLGVGGAVGPAPLANSGDLGLDGADRPPQPVLLGCRQRPTMASSRCSTRPRWPGRSSSAPAGPTPGWTKSAAVKAAGGVGMILANASDAQTLNADFTPSRPCTSRPPTARRSRRMPPRVAADGNDQRHRHHAGACSGDGRLLVLRGPARRRREPAQAGYHRPGVDIAAVSPNW